MSKKEFIKSLENVSYNRNRDELFRDFCELSALSIASPFYGKQVADDLEKLHKKYSKEEIVKLDKCFSLMVEDLENDNRDYLGEIYGEIELGGRGKGDFFTPYHVSLLNAQMVLVDLKEQLKTKHYLTIAEPACGSGGMVIACRQVFIEQKCNPSWDMFVTATDISALCFHMTYIQLSLYGISAEVFHGDTLTLKTWRSFYTPTVFLLPWRDRFLVKRLMNSLEEKPTEQEQVQIELL